MVGEASGCGEQHEDRGGALDRLEAFAALNGPELYRLPVNESRVTLKREPFPVPEHIGTSESAVAAFRGGETLHWRLAVIGHAIV